MLSTVLAIAISQQPATATAVASELRNLPTESVIQRGDFYYAKEDWQSSSFAYQILIERIPRQSNYRLRHGKSLVELKQYSNAIAPLRFARDAQFDLPQTNFLLSRAYAGLKMEDIALKYLDEAVKNNFEDIEATKKAPELSILKGNKKFDSLLEQIEFPAIKEPGGKVLDFLIGTWLYKTDDGLSAGQSTVIKTEKGYQVKESWSDSNGTVATTTFDLKTESARWFYTLESSDGRKGKGEIKAIPNGIERQGTLTYPDGFNQFVKESLTRNNDSSITITTLHSYDEGDTWVEVARGSLAQIATPKPRPDSVVVISSPQSVATVKSPKNQVIITVGG